jgi:hypothetical protein
LRLSSNAGDESRNVCKCALGSIDPSINSPPISGLLGCLLIYKKVQKKPNVLPTSW